MNYAMGLEHRKAILESLPEKGKMLEWGSGGSTVWFSENMKSTQKLVSVEHNINWHIKVKSAIKNPNIILYHIPATDIVGKNSSPGEELPVGLADYIWQPYNLDHFNVILVDGVARNMCLAVAKLVLKTGGVVFLHDSQRSWYEAGKRFFETVKVLESCIDYPGPELWMGQ